MKKLSIIVLILAIFAVFALSACNKKNNPSASSSSSESSSSVESKVDRGSSPNLSVSPSNISVSGTDGTSTTGSNANVGSAVTVTSVPTEDQTAVGDAIRAINRIGTIDSGSYEQKAELILNAENKCNLVSDKTAITNYQSFLEAKSAYNTFKARGEVNAFMTKYNALPEATAVAQSNVITVCELRSTYNAFSSEALALLTNKEDIKAKLDACFNKLYTDGFLENKLVLDNVTSLSESAFFKFSQGLSVQSTSNDKMLYSGSYLTKNVQLVAGESITFTTYITGNLVLYCYRTDTLSITNGTTAITQTNVDTSLGDDYCIRTFAITSTGEYSISLIEGEVFVFALEMKAN